ncbi:uncharacterized protein LOC132993611 isoform X1 [Labrus mixtus]|uniref:uncharacterized protein LOC132993611 isoform X1 n=1 Tax=Labrus mixtus TaxID=508554 RepID=UPI0029C06E3B|nr:uncharacterized protein LOC132993611 isoform X1 [Labrus mixtus]
MEELERLPPEVWVYIFSYLSTEEKHTVRTCCRFMKTVVDHHSLWKDYTVVLSDLRRYTYGFWDTLNHRRLTRVAVRRLRRKEWRRLVTFLPSITAIVFVEDGGRLYKEKYLDNLSRFPDLRDLGVRNATWDQGMLGQSLSEHLRERLTHLSVCNVRLPCTVHFVSTVAHLVNLRYLVFHQQGESYWPDRVRPVPCNVFNHLLLNLKKLRHLSWGMKGEPPQPLPDDFFSPADPEQPGKYGGPALTSLELLDYPEPILAENALRSLTSLRSLMVRYSFMREGVRCRLRSWLSPLQQLETLTIVGGNTLASYTTTIPSSVKRLTLRVAITLKDMDLIAPAVPGLEHLDIEQNRSTGNLCRRIPMLFPQLKSLRIRFHRKEPEKELLCLHKLRHLERLELLVDRSFIFRDYTNGPSWPSPGVQEIIDQLQQLANNRITVVTKVPQRDLLRQCDCLCEVD